MLVVLFNVLSESSQPKENLLWRPCGDGLYTGLWQWRWNKVNVMEAELEFSATLLSTHVVSVHEWHRKMLVEIISVMWNFVWEYYRFAPMGICQKEHIQAFKKVPTKHIFHLYCEATLSPTPGEITPNLNVFTIYHPILPLMTHYILIDDQMSTIY